jgi:hypothetical protein
MLLAAAVAATALSVAACSDSNNASSGATTTTAGPTTTASAAEAAAWMDKVCGEFVDLAEMPPPPSDLAEGGQQQALDRFDKYLAEKIDGVNKAINDLGQVGEPPIRGGVQVVNALLRGLAAMRNSLQVTKDKFASIDPNNPQQARAALQDSLESLDQGGAEFDKAVDSVQTNKDLEQAINAAPNCQKLDVTSTTSGTAVATTTM